MPKYFLIDEFHDVVYVCDDRQEAEHYMKTWAHLNTNTEFATKVFLYERSE